LGLWNYLECDVTRRVGDSLFYPKGWRIGFRNLKAGQPQIVNAAHIVHLSAPLASGKRVP
jgi:hypothetical protein